jgi:hypothetical protein
MFRLTTAIILFALSALTWSLPQPATHDLNPSLQEKTKASTPSPHFPDPLITLLDLQEPPPADAYAITGNYLPPFLQEVMRTWQQEFPRIPLTTNSIIFVIRPAEFYSDMNPEQGAWLASREMLGIRNFPLIINPLTPGDDWYLTAQQEWKRGNNDAIYILLTSLFHEVTHTRDGADESAAYQHQLALFQRFRKQGKLASPYARACQESLRNRSADLRKHPEQYVQVQVRFQRQTIALLVHSPKTSPAPQNRPF